MLPDRVIKGLRWIVTILNENAIPYQLCGGLAARVYGSTREINDIDIEIPDKDIERLAFLVKSYIVSGPEYLLDHVWDLHLLMLKCGEQDIDISGSDEIRICDQQTGIWQDQRSDLSLAEAHVLDGVTVKVMPPVPLARYKRLLTGDHQKLDIEAVEQYIQQH